MTQDEIIEMSKESGMELIGLGKPRNIFIHHLSAFAKLVAAKEREACALIADSMDACQDGEIGKAIRASRQNLEDIVI